MGPGRHWDLPDRQHAVPVRGVTAGPGKPARPHNRLAKRHVHDAGARLARQSPSVEDADCRRNSALRAHAPDLRVGALDRFVGLCGDHGRGRMALHDLRPLLRHRRGALRRIGRCHHDGPHALALEVGRLHKARALRRAGCRLLIVVATGWLGFTFLELIFALYTLEGPEIALREMQLFTWPWNALFIVFLLTAYFIPVPLWLFKKVRNNIAAMFWTSILVNIGMWLERFFIVVPGLARKTPFTFAWESYKPSPIEWFLLGWSVAWVLFLMLMFARFFPLVPLVRAKREPGIHNRHEDRTGHRAGDHQGAGVRVKWHQ